MWEVTKAWTSIAADSESSDHQTCRSFIAQFHSFHFTGNTTSYKKQLCWCHFPLNSYHKIHGQLASTDVFDFCQITTVLFGTQQRLHAFPHITSINIAGSVVHLSDTVTTLGVNLDETLNLQWHANNLCKSSYYHLRALCHIRASLADDICLSLGTALVQSRLDYSNFVLYDTSASNLHKLQMVQNALARTITRSPRSVLTYQLLSNLHWLPIHKRINFKVAILTYKVLSTQPPAYLYNLMSYYQPSRMLRSSSQSLLQVPRVKTDFGRRALSSAAPQIWNHIPATIKVSPCLTPSNVTSKHTILHHHNFLTT